MYAIDTVIMFGGENSITCIFNNKNDTFQVLTNSPTIEDQDKIIIGIPYIFLKVFVLTSNLMLIYGFYKTSRPFTLINKLFIYLSLVDIAYISCMYLLQVYYTSTRSFLVYLYTLFSWCWHFPTILFLI